MSEKKELITVHNSLEEVGKIFSEVFNAICSDCKLFNRCHQKGTEYRHKTPIHCDSFDPNQSKKAICPFGKKYDSCGSQCGYFQLAEGGNMPSGNICNHPVNLAENQSSATDKKLSIFSEEVSDFKETFDIKEEK